MWKLRQCRGKFFKAFESTLKASQEQHTPIYFIMYFAFPRANLKLTAIFSPCVMRPFINIPTSSIRYFEYWSMMHCALSLKFLIVALFHHCFMFPTRSNCLPLSSKPCVISFIILKKTFVIKSSCGEWYEKTYRVQSQLLCHRS